MTLEDIFKKTVKAKIIPVDEVMVGMVSATDVKTPAGAIIMPADHVIEERDIPYLKSFEILKFEMVVAHKPIPVRAKQTPVNDPHKQNKKIEQPRAIIVDDSNIMRRALRTILEQIGVDIVAEADSGENALAIASSYKPDFITLDIKMPGMDGVTTLKHLSNKHPEIKVIMVSMESSGDKIIECIKNGAVDFIHKPFETKRVQKAITNTLRTLPAFSSM